MNNEVNNEMNRTNKSRYKVDKKMLSRVGFALTATALIDFIIQNGVGVICKLYFPAIFAYKYFSLILMIVSLYMIAIPIGLLILNSVIKANESAEDKRIGFFEMILWCVVAVPMMYIGSYIGQIINTVLNTVIGAPSSSSLGEFIASLPLWLVFLIVVVLGPFMEELLFRRGVTEALRPWGWKMAVIIGGVAFGLFHQNLEQFFYAAMVGALLGYIYLYTGKLRYSVIIHMFINFIGSFVPTVISRISYSEEQFEAFVASYEQYMAQLGEGATELPTEAIQELYAAMAKVLPGLMLTLNYTGMIYGLIGVGIFVFFYFRRRFHFKSAERVIEGEYIGDTVFLAPGVLAFVIVSLAFIVLRIALTR